MNRKNTITRAEFNEIKNKLNELCEIIDQYNTLYRDIDDLCCLDESLHFLEHDLIKDLKLVD